MTVLFFARQTQQFLPLIFKIIVGTHRRYKMFFKTMDFLRLEFRQPIFEEISNVFFGERRKQK